MDPKVPLRSRFCAQAAQHDTLPDDSVRLVRLAFRRLRTATRTAAEAVELPSGVKPKRLSPAVHALSVPRDAEAMADTLRAASEAVMRDKVHSIARSSGDGGNKDNSHDGKDTKAGIDEAATLAAALEALERRKADGFEEAAQELAAPRTRDALRALRAATKKRPKPLDAGALPAHAGAAALLHRRADDLFTHSAWALERLLPPRARGPGKSAAPWERALHVEAAKCANLHDLRKHIREVRYAMELFAPLFAHEPQFEAQIDVMTALQGAIGTMHDVQVCLEFEPELVRCSALVHALRAAHDAAWADFRARRAALLTPQGTAAFVGVLLSS